MTDDLVKQLPEYHNLTVESAAIFKVIEARLAASSKDKTDRIEKLEAALREIVDLSKGMSYLLGFTPADIARKALGDEPISDLEARIIINKARKALEGKDD